MEKNGKESIIQIVYQIFFSTMPNIDLDGE